MGQFLIFWLHISLFCSLFRAQGSVNIFKAIVFRKKFLLDSTWSMGWTRNVFIDVSPCFWNISSLSCKMLDLWTVKIFQFIFQVFNILIPLHWPLTIICAHNWVKVLLPTSISIHLLLLSGIRVLFNIVKLVFKWACVMRPRNSRRFRWKYVSQVNYIILPIRWIVSVLTVLSK